MTDTVVKVHETTHIAQSYILTAVILGTVLILLGVCFLILGRKK